ncbi:MAG TPA: efflux RND transporter periplasmic adaptor subunit [Geminicoccaceae bacterium]|nr:efflux RND transporter periplasmic adaptor subunit [Geminicoccus sp.]HMU52068.1 efflux RND transporter periplasmic adaptor subunit [Geminicoccaceae bacterium]
MSLLRQIVVLLALAAVAVGGWLWLGPTTGPAAERGSGPRAVPVLLAQVTETEIRESVEAVATTRASDAVEIVPLVDGRIESLDFAPGQRVKKGDLLATLDSEVERAAVDEAKAMLGDARAQFERSQTLAKTRSVADARVDELQAAYLSAQAKLATAEKHLAEREIRAPFEGIVGLREVSVGARVDDTTKITTLDSLDELEIEFSVPEQYYGRVGVGSEILATASNYPGREFKGVVASVDSRVDAVARAFRVRADLPNADLALPAGMFMVVEIVLDTRKALVVPEQAVLSQGRSTFVFRRQGDKVERLEVGLGVRRYGEAEIAKGLSLGDEVAITGLQRLRDGSPVTIQQAPATTPVS